MTNIPEDIMAKAQEIVPSVHWTSWATGDEIAEIIAAALLSERTAQEAEIARLTKERDTYIRACDSYEEEVSELETRVAELEKALEEAKNFIDKASGEDLGISMSGSNHPNWDEILLVRAHAGIDLAARIRAALTPAKENTDAG